MWQVRGPNLDSSLLPNRLGGKYEREKERNRKEGIFRERVSNFSIIPDDRTVESRGAKRQSCSPGQGLRVDTDFVELRLLREIGVFSYSIYFRFKSHKNGLDGMRP